MAATLTHKQELTFVSFPVDKIETTPDGDVLVWGKATDGIVDSDDQIVDPGWAAKAIKDWFDSGANLRVQHNPSRDPAGKGVEIYDDGNGGQWVKSLVVEPVAKELVKKGVLQAYSVGIMRPVIVHDQMARNGRITGGELGELSLVDRPANKGCRFELVKSAAGGAPEFTGKMFGTDTLTKAVTDTVTVELPHDVNVSFSPADLAKMLGKRSVDPNVGGGVDRDKIAAEDFAGRDRSFPIVTPGDVSDAASSIGRAGSDNYSADQLKANIKRIAHRKGPAFAAELPDSWKDSMTDSDEAVKAEKKPAFPGAAEPFGREDADGKDSDGDGKDVDKGADSDGDIGDDDMEKSLFGTGGGDDTDHVSKGGGKNCKECGKTYHSDSKMKRCENCGAKLPVAEIDKAKSAPDADAEDESDTGGGDESAEYDGGDSYDDGDSDSDDDDDKPAKKAFKPKMQCSKCMKMCKGSAKFCPKCGASMGAPDMTKKGAKRSKPTPADGVTGMHADPVPNHREPDGAAIEAFEADAKLPTDPDSQYKSAMRVQGLGIPQDMASIHDLLCPGYSAQAAHAAHPYTTLKSVHVDTWRQKAYDAAAGGTYEEMMGAAKMLQCAETLVATDDRVLEELRDEARAAFKAINPEQTTAVHPGSITPGQFRRPFISGPDARPSFQQMGPNTGPGGFAEIMPSQFHRPFLGGDTASESPSGSGGTTAVPPPPRTGVPTRVNLGPALKDNARQAMNAMHDHIAQTFPDLCPMRGPGDEGSRPVNPGISEVGKGVTMTVSKADVIQDASQSDPVVPVSDGVEMLAKAFAPDVLKGVIAEATAPILARLNEAEQELKKQRKVNKSLASQLDSMAGDPDPRVAPFKGLAQDMVSKSYGGPVGVPNAAGIVQQTQLMVQNELAMQARDNTDPVQREAALNALMRQRGLI
jgi:hypothetical protein